ncbi:MAG: hypothetical protein NZ529_08840 [Cytophagaceae bacterium]|nr:hypothetical protein [Cytophagaceae bacterium]MDW8456889.1 hypothetical protein [Cytophagaceae bacterium]
MKTTVTMIEPNASSKNISTNWAQVASLGALNAAVAISWIAYHNYQPAVVKKFNFFDLAYFITIVQALVLVVIPPLAGLAGDYFIKKNGKRLLVFTAGTSATAMIFMAVAGLVNLDPLSSVKWVLPVMIVLWLIFMNVFHSPANSLLELFAPTSGLPIAMAVITMINDVIYGLEPIVVDLVNFIGPTLTFVTGGVLLVITGVIFIRTTRNIPVENSSEKAERKSNYAAILLVGLAFGLITAFIFKVLPEILSIKLPEYDSKIFGGNHFSTVILLIAAFLAIPSSKIAENTGLIQSLIVGIVLSCISILMIIFNDIKGALQLAALCLGLGYSLISVSALPFTLQNISSRNLTFGVGMFFGSLEIAPGIFDVFLFKN